MHGLRVSRVGLKTYSFSTGCRYFVSPSAHKIAENLFEPHIQSGGLYVPSSKILRILCRGWGSNPRPQAYESCALPAELPRQVFYCCNFFATSDGTIPSLLPKFNLTLLFWTQNRLSFYNIVWVSYRNPSILRHHYDRVLLGVGGHTISQQVLVVHRELCLKRKDV